MIPLDSEGELFLGEIIFRSLPWGCCCSRRERNGSGTGSSDLPVGARPYAGRLHAGRRRPPHQTARLFKRLGTIIVLGMNFVGPHPRFAGRRLPVVVLAGAGFWIRCHLSRNGYSLRLVEIQLCALRLPSFCLAAFLSRFGAEMLMGLYGLANVTLLDSRAFGGVSFVVAVLLMARTRARRKT